MKYGEERAIRMDQDTQVGYEINGDYGSDNEKGINI